MSGGPLTREGLQVCSQMCSTCIFRPGNLMHLQGGRVRKMVEEALENDAFIVCHKTLEGERSICRGFYDRHADASLGCRLGNLVGVIDINPDQ